MGWINLKDQTTIEASRGVNPDVTVCNNPDCNTQALTEGVASSFIEWNGDYYCLPLCKKAVQMGVYQGNPSGPPTE